MPAETGFQLDSRLAADTLPATALALCDVLLMNDATYPWLILVPRRADMADIIDLSVEDQHRLTDEVSRASHVLRAVFNPDKLNVAALGNMVRQLHVHVIARYTNDAAWPAPVWGRAPASPYDKAAAAQRIARLQAAFLDEQNS